MSQSDLIQQHTQDLQTFWQALIGGDAAAAHQYLATDFEYNGPHPINTLSGPRAFVEQFYMPLRASFPDLRRTPDIQFGSEFEGNLWVCSTGYFDGVFTADWLGIPSTGQPTGIRFGEFWRFAEGKISECVMILDIVDVMRQAGFSVLQGYGGRPGRVPPPRAGDGLSVPDEAATAISLRLTEAMIYEGLMAYDGKTLESMHMVDYWTPDMKWYGPHPIGACESLREFEDFHQRPFLEAFPDRKGGNHKARVAAGLYVASTGWPSLRATNLGDYLGVAATGKPITMRVMDWWRRNGDLLDENWVFIDLIDLCLQMGVDVFATMRKQIAKS